MPDVLICDDRTSLSYLPGSVRLAVCSDGLAVGISGAKVYIDAADSSRCEAKVSIGRQGRDYRGISILGG